MSDSRLEKFIYAICSMDVTDLPVPISRIEKLWNCLITGEAPDFEPLSRNEKYLMAMLDRYDISNLPAPMSRGEKLLYKIAVGETDLSDVPGYLSRYEELLKYLIENGGIGDFEYVLYTLNQSLNTLYTTAEKPVKSAILKGQTLVNLATKNTRHDGSATVTFTDTGHSIKIVFNSSGSRVVSFKLNQTLKSNTKYLFIAKCTKNFDTAPAVSFFNGSSFGVDLVPTNNKGKVIITTTDASLYTHVTFGLHGGMIEGNEFEVDYPVFIEYQNGMENWDIPYFEGMQSVKMPVLKATGKNLFPDINFSNNHIYKKVANGIQIIKDYESAWIPMLDNLSIPMPKGDYVLSSELVEGEYTGGVMRLDYSDGTYSNEFWFLNDIGLRKSIKFNNTSDKILKRIKIWNPKGNAIFQYQLEQGTVATPYEPYKSNILTTPEDLELRGIGDVRDELNVATGELTERIGEIKTNNIINEITITKRYTDKLIIRLPLTLKTTTSPTNLSCPYLLCDKLKTLSFKHGYADNTEIGVYVHNTNTDYIYMCILNSNLVSNNLDGIKEYLTANPSTIQYKLLESTVKTVDLTVVDQDNQPTQLGTFENVTHVSLESAGLIPEVEMEVATHISEELASASPLMDDISTKQEQLNTMVDEQSNNVDATMIATTEIYEETL